MDIFLSVGVYSCRFKVGLQGHGCLLHSVSSRWTGLAGATADVHCYDIHTNKWTRSDHQGTAFALSQDLFGGDYAY